MQEVQQKQSAAWNQKSKVTIFKFFLWVVQENLLIVSEMKSTGKCLNSVLMFVLTTFSKSKEMLLNKISLCLSACESRAKFCI